jgi:hypothetical protein
LEGERVLCRDGSHESIERQAEMFSAPAHPARIAHGGATSGTLVRWSVLYRLAERFVVSPTAMQVRLEKLDWMHLTEERDLRSGPPPADGQGTLFAA